MTKLFEAIDQAHDGKARAVFICQDAQGFYVFKPATGFKTKHWKTKNSKPLQACFERQVSCTQNNGFFEKGEAPAADENYSLVAVDENTKSKVADEAVKEPIAAPGAAGTGNGTEEDKTKDNL